MADTADFMQVADGSRHPASGAPQPTDDERLTSFFYTHWDGAYRLAVLIGASDPEDVAQEAFTRIWPKLATLEREGNAEAYLRRIICNLSTSKWRRLRTAQKFEPLLRTEHARNTSVVGLESEQRMVLQRAVSKLSSRQREVLVLRYWTDMTEAEVAQCLGLSVGSVKTHTSRGVQRLKSLLGDDND